MQISKQVRGCVVMKKVLASVVFIGICYILFLPLPAVMASEGRLGVFFATRDLEGLKIF
jgi:hypothetical protein